MFWTAFWPLFLAGFVGVAIFALTAPQQLLDKIPIDGVRKRLLVVVQPMVLLLILTAAGAAVAGSVGSQSLLVDAVRGDPLPDDWLSPLLIFFGVGIVGGALLYAGDRWARPLWGEAADVDLIAQWRPRDVIPGVTYGGITEEVMMRWGLMGLLLWVFSGFGGDGAPPTIAAIIAIALAALIFAAGHLPAALLGGRRSARFILRILVLNSLAGLLFGWLFWRWNLETAMAAHAGFHVGAAALVLAMGGGRRPA